MKVEALQSQEKYRELCESESSIPLFSQAWWLDALVGPDSWGAVLALRGDQVVVGALPYVHRHRWGMVYLTQPPLTQALGPWLRPSEAKYARALGNEKDVLGALADGLPRFASYQQNWDVARTNWLPFYWRGFSQTTRYTYRLALLCDEESVWQSLQENIRSDIRKARDRYALVVEPAESLDEFLGVNRKTFTRQSRRPPYSDRLISALHNAATARKASDVLLAKDPQGNVHAGAFVVRDATTAYYLMGGGDPDHRSSGAGSLCLWEAIRRQPGHIEIFDFEGSMLEPVERFFRAFGAVQTPYFRVKRRDSRILRTAECWRNLLRRNR